MDASSFETTATEATTGLQTDLPARQQPKHLGASVPQSENVLENPYAGTNPQKTMSLWQLFNISIGFLGIQFAWSIQMGQMSPLLETLGSDPRLTGLISTAGPITGVLVQPIVGALSDKSRHTMGRRRPFLLAGAVLTAISLILMPNSVNLLMAAILLWILDASINLSQGPYRALVPDVVPKAQQATAYSLMSLTIGLGSVLAFLIGFWITSLPLLFYTGAAAMLLAMAYTSYTTSEPRPEASTVQISGAQISGQKEDNFFVAILKTVTQMPSEAIKLCVAHSFTWFGLACLFVYFSLYVPHHVFGASGPQDPMYQKGVQWVSLCYAVMNAVCFGFSAFIGKLSNLTSKKAVHTGGLLCLGLSLLSMFVLHTPMQVMLAMACIGIGWATTLSLPFALLTEHMPKGKEGVLMGTFNVFIAAPGVLSNIIVGSVIAQFNNNVALGMMLGGAAVLLSAVLLQTVRETKPTGSTTAETQPALGH